MDVEPSLEKFAHDVPCVHVIVAAELCSRANAATAYSPAMLTFPDVVAVIDAIVDDPDPDA